MDLSKVIKPLSISLKLIGITVSGVLWYYTYKHVLRSHVNRSSASISDEATESYKVVRLKIPTYVKGAIIGKNGSVIRRIQDRTKTTIKFVGKVISEKEISENQDGDWIDKNSTYVTETYDELMIRGLTLRVLEAEKEIKEIVANAPVYIEDTIMVDNRFIGKIIGKAGENVKRLKETYDVFIEVDRNNNPERKIKLRGIHENIEECKSDIMKLIERNANLSESQLDRPISARRKLDLSPSQFSLTSWKIEETKTIYVCSVINCNKIYVHVSHENLTKLQSLVEKMTLYFNEEPSLINERYLNIGDVLAGFHKQTQSWQRIKVLELKDNGCQVLYLDYGDSGYLKISDMRSFVKCSHFLQLPIQGVRLNLYGVYAKNDYWPEENIVEFENLVKVGEDYPLVATLKTNNSEVYEVSLYDEQTNTNINEILMDAAKQELEVERSVE